MRSATEPRDARLTLQDIPSIHLVPRVWYVEQVYMTSIISFLGRSVRLLSHFCAYHAAPFGNPPCALRGLAREKEQGGRNDRGAGVKEREGEREGRECQQQVA